MMGLGPTGSGAGGNSSSTTSNLSALAPPFTVDRLNPKPNSNPNLHYSDSPYTAEPYNHGWQYASPSAPIPELVFESTGITSMPLSDDYQYSALETVSPTSNTHWSALNSGNKPSASAFAYGGEVKPYYSPYVPLLVRGEDSLLVEDEGSRYNGPTSGPSVKSQSLWDVDYETQWVDNLGFDDGKRAKRVELEGSFFEKENLGGSHSYKNQLNRGGCDTEMNKKKSTENSGVSYQKFNQVSDREIHTGSLTVAQKEDKSCHEQNIGFFPYDSNKTRTSAYISTYPKPYHSVLSSDTHKNISNDRNSFEKCIKPFDKPFIGSVSAIMPSPTVVIRPPPATNGKFGQRTFSHKPARCDNVESVQGVDIGPKPNSFETNLFDISKQVNNGLTSSTPVKELSSPLHSRDPFDRKIKARFGSQLPDVNILGGFNLACDNNDVQVVNPVENLSDFVDHQSTAVDSPCWKGASSSQFSLFDIEAGSSNQVKNTDEFYQNFHSVIDCSRAFSEKAGESNKNIEKNECDAICSSKEHSLLGDAKGRGWISTTSGNKGTAISNEPNMPRKESVVLHDLTCGFDMKISDAKNLISEGVKMSLNDVSGGAVAVHAAEKVLASPASQEDATERTILSDRKLNVPTVLKAIHNLSELLVFHFSSDDACYLEEENTETLEKIISNLHSCLNNKIIGISQKPETNNPVGDASDKRREPLDVDTILESPHTTNEAPDPHIQRQHMHEDERNCSLSGKKDEKSPIFSPLGDDLDITRDDDMTKAIKKVLEENFHINEEMHSQALLFKNLWLDAEAKLCSSSYRARFDRMKIQMEQIKIKAPQGIEETMSEVCVSPDHITASELGPKGHDGPIPKPTLQNVPISSTSGPADSMDASAMKMLNILKSSLEYVKPISTEDEQQKPKMVDGECEGSIMARFNILKSREENSAKSTSMEVEKQSKMIDGEFVSEKYVGPCIISRSEDETLNVGLKTPQTGCLNEGKFGSYVPGAGYETLDEFHLSVINDPIIHSFKNSRMIDQNNLGRRDSSSSDWEHVLKGDFSWKKL